LIALDTTENNAKRVEAEKFCSKKREQRMIHWIVAVDGSFVGVKWANNQKFSLGIQLEGNSTRFSLQLIPSFATQNNPTR
jgi:hypothetical protein